MVFGTWKVAQMFRATPNISLSTGGELLSHCLEPQMTVAESRASDRRESPGVRWRERPDVLSFFVLFAAWLALFHLWGNATFGFVKTSSLFGWMFYVFSTSVDDQVCLFVPVFMLLLFYWKREELRTVPKWNWWPAILPVAAGLAMHIIGFMVQQTRISVLGFFAGLYGLMGLIWGPLFMKATFFPMCLAIFCVPLGTMADSITLPLRILVTKISVGFAHELLGIEVYRNGAQIFSGAGIPLYDVAPACSGIRSLTALLLLTTVYACTAFKANWKRVLIIAAAVPLAILGNVVRVTVVLLVYATFSQNAGAIVEQKLGFLTFAVAVICLLGISHWLREPKARQNSEVRAI